MAFFVKFLNPPFQTDSHPCIRIGGPVAYIGGPVAWSLDPVWHRHSELWKILGKS